MGRRRGNTRSPQNKLPRPQPPRPSCSYPWRRTWDPRDIGERSHWGKKDPLLGFSCSGGDLLGPAQPDVLTSWACRLDLALRWGNLLTLFSSPARSSSQRARSSKKEDFLGKVGLKDDLGPDARRMIAFWQVLSPAGVTYVENLPDPRSTCSRFHGPGGGLYTFSRKVLREKNEVCI
jgi:hypothetical protein